MACLFTSIVITLTLLMLKHMWLID
jgi:hypothetical protein